MFFHPRPGCLSASDEQLTAGCVFRTVGLMSTRGGSWDEIRVYGENFLDCLTYMNSPQLLDPRRFIKVFIKMQ